RVAVRRVRSAMRWLHRWAGVAHRATATGSPAMLSLIIVDDEAGVDHTGNPAEEREQQTKNETQEPAGHEHGDRRKDDAKKVAERFQRMFFAKLRATAGSRQSMIGPHRRVDLLQRRPGLRFAGLAE